LYVSYLINELRKTISAPSSFDHTAFHTVASPLPASAASAAEATKLNERLVNTIH